MKVLLIIVLLGLAGCASCQEREPASLQQQIPSEETSTYKW